VRFRRLRRTKTELQFQMQFEINRATGGAINLLKAVTSFAEDRNVSKSYCPRQP